MSLFTQVSIHPSVGFTVGKGDFMSSASDYHKFTIKPTPPRRFFSKPLPERRVALSAPSQSQALLKSGRCCIKRAIVGLAITTLSASALLPGAHAASQVIASPSSLSWYKVAVGNTGGGKSVTLTNSGSSTIILSSISITGANSGDFYTASNKCGTTLAANASCSLYVYFRPIAVGTRTATLTYNVSNSPQQVFLSGLGASVSAAPGSLSFGSLSVGSRSASQTITISNGTANSVLLSSGAITGANPAVFTITSATCGYSLAASASCTASIAFTPSGAASYTANWTITAGSNQLSVLLFGTGTRMSVSPSSLSWYKVAVGNTGGAKSVIFTNSGSSAVSISGISITGTNSGDFYIAANTCGTSLAANASCNLYVYFRPVTVGTRTAALTYVVSASNSPQQVSLSGLGTTIYYVSNCGIIGSDSNNGSSPSTPWLTVAKVNSSTFRPGDTIEFHDGCTWREELNLPSSGTAAYPITVTTYGSGNPPIISGSQVIALWTDEPQSPINFTSDHSLQAYWNMDQISGSNFLDATSNGNNLVNINGVTLDTNHMQGSYSANFDAAHGMELSRSDSALSAGFPGKNGTTNASITVGGWIYFDSSNANKRFISKGTGAWELFKGTGPSVGKMSWQIFTNSSNHCVQSDNGNLLTPDTWYHVIGRLDGTTGEQALFINGVKQTQTYNNGGAALFTDTAALQIGGDGSNFLDGRVDELFVFNRPLSDSEIARIYTGRLDGSNGSYKLYYAGYHNSPLAVYESGVAMRYVAQKTGMTPGSWYWDASNTRIYIRPTGDVDPATETFEIPQRLTCITDSRNYTTITGLSCQQPAQKGVFVTGANVTVQNMLINNVRENGPNSPNLNAAGVGIFWEGNNDVIQNNIVANANWGIVSDVPAGQTISGLIQGNTIYNIGYDGIGFAISDRNGGTLSNTIAQNNVLHDIGIYNLQGGAIECILSGSALGTGNIFRYNLMYSIGNAHKNAFPMNVQGGAGSCAFYGNVVYNSYGPCMSVHNGPGGNRFYNNTCYNNGLAGAQGAGIYIDGGSADTGNIFKNNIIYASSNTTFTYVMAGATSNTLDENLYFGGTPAPFNWNGAVYNVANYLAASGQDAHSVLADPLLAGPSTNDFSLLPNSPAISSGANLGSAYQLDLAPGSVWPFNVKTANQTTNGAWDIGAYVSPP